jgi:hypothetical protein
VLLHSCSNRVVCETRQLLSANGRFAVCKNYCAVTSRLWLFCRKRVLRDDWIIIVDHAVLRVIVFSLGGPLRPVGLLDPYAFVTNSLVAVLHYATAVQCLTCSVLLCLLKSHANVVHTRCMLYACVSSGFVGQVLGMEKMVCSFCDVYSGLDYVQ